MRRMDEVLGSKRAIAAEFALVAALLVAALMPTLNGLGTDLVETFTSLIANLNAS